jgi:hypothetical protein
VCVLCVCVCELGLARVVRRNDCYPPHLGLVPTSDCWIGERGGESVIV